MYNRVIFQGGPSRFSEESCDFMLATVLIDGEETELYAEAENPTWDEEKEDFADPYATYDDLKAQIIEQAIEKGIDPESLYFE